MPIDESDLGASPRQLVVVVRRPEINDGPYAGIPDAFDRPAHVAAVRERLSPNTTAKDGTQVADSKTRKSGIVHAIPFHTVPLATARRSSTCFRVFSMAFAWAQAEIRANSGSP